MAKKRSIKTKPKDVSSPNRNKKIDLRGWWHSGESWLLRMCLKTLIKIANRPKSNEIMEPIMFMLARRKENKNKKTGLWWTQTMRIRTSKGGKCNSEHYAIERSEAVENSSIRLIAHDQQNFNFGNDFWFIIHVKSKRIRWNEGESTSNLIN